MAANGGFANASKNFPLEMAGSDGFANGSIFFLLSMAGKNGFANAENLEMALCTTFARYKKLQEAF